MHEEKRALLNSILPEEISNRLLAGEVIADLRDSACVFFMDIAGFTDFSSRHTPTDVVSIFSRCCAQI